MDFAKQCENILDEQDKILKIIEDAHVEIPSGLRNAIDASRKWADAVRSHEDVTPRAPLDLVEQIERSREHFGKFPETEFDAFRDLVDRYATDYAESELQ